MDSHVNKLIELGYVPISCNTKKIPICKEWTTITIDNCIDKIKKNCNIGLLTGNKSGITVVDIDVKDKGLSTWQQLIELHGEPKTIKVRTGSGGLHYYFKYTNQLKSDSKVIVFEGEKVGIDIKNDGNKILL